MTKLIYLASPHSHPIVHVRNARCRAVRKCAAKLMQSGVFVYSPISHNHDIAPLIDDPSVFDFDYWREFDFRMIRACDELCVAKIQGWRESKGVTAEIRYANELKMPVTYLDT